MSFIWFGFITQLLLYSLFSSTFNNHEENMLIIIGIHFIIVTMYVGRFDKKIRLIFYASFVIRLIVMFIDIYMNSIINIPHSGADTEKFYNWALDLTGSIPNILSSGHELYVKMIAILFTFVAQERIIAQYINVLLGFSTVYFVYLILSKLEINKKLILIGTSVVAFMPHSIFFSALLLREMISTFFVVVAVYFLVEWYFSLKKKYFYVSIVFILVSSLFHSGVIGFLLAHLFIILFFDKENKMFKFTVSTLIFFSILMLFFGWFFGVYDWNNLAIFRKLNIDSLQDLFESSSSRVGGSMYLTNLKISNVFEMILYTPIFIVYFISSPLPLNWRGFSDIISFLMDGIVYLIMSIYILYNVRLKNRISKYHSLSIILFIGILGVLFIFSIGVQNAGTAMRHRQKIFPILTVLVILIKQHSRDNITNTNLI